MFEPDTSWSLPAHLYLVSEWSARCTPPRRPAELPDCGREADVAAARGRLNPTDARARTTPGPTSRTCCTSITSAGATTSSPARARLRGRRDVLRPVPQSAQTPGIWNPLPYFDDGQARPSARQHRVDLRASSRPHARDAARGLVGDPEQPVSEHPPTRITAARRSSPASSTRSCAARTGARRRSSLPGTTGAASTTTSLHRRSTRNGYGLRVPALVISPVRAAGLRRSPGAELRRLR